MSMISDLLRKIRAYEKQYRSGDTLGRAIVETEDVLKEAADTIEALSAKLAAANMERSSAYYGGGWISVEDRLPEDFGRYLSTLEDIHGELFVKISEFDPDDRAKWWIGDARLASMGYKILAWMPLPEPYKGD